MRTLREPYIFSVSGRDRPGLLARIATALDEAEIDIVDIEQATLQDFLALSFLLDLEGDAERGRRLLRDLLPLAGELGLAVDVRGLDADQVKHLKESDHVVLTVVSERPTSRMVAELATVTARHDANIVSIRRLAEEDLRAGEYVLDVTGVSDREGLRADLFSIAERLGVDVALAREDVYRKSKRIVVFDMDSTLLQAEVIDCLAARAGVEEEVAGITRDAMEGRIEFGESLRRRTALLSGLPVTVLEEVAKSIPLTPGAEETLRVLKRLGFKLGVVSGGFSWFVERVGDRLGVDYVFANHLEIEDGTLTGNLVPPILDGPGKAERLREIAAKEGVPVDQVVGVGDGANDVPMLQTAGLGIAFRAKDVTRRSADAAIQRNTFAGLLHLLGVSGRDVQRLEEG